MGVKTGRETGIGGVVSLTGFPGAAQDFLATSGDLSFKSRAHAHVLIEMDTYDCIHP
jgi:hypothetical protein